MRYFRYLLAMAVCAATAAPALAQSLPGFGGAAGSAMGNSMGSGMGSAMGNSMGNSMGGSMPGLPALSSATPGNVAGVLSYCVKNNLVQGASAASTLSSLTGKSGITSSSGYQAGAQGDIQSGTGSNLSLDGVSQQMKTQACDLVLKHAQSLL